MTFFRKRYIYYVHRCILFVCLLYICFFFYQIMTPQIGVIFSTLAPRPFLYFILGYLYIWWFTRYEGFRWKFWNTERKVVHVAVVKSLYFLLFVVEVVISIIIATNFDEIFLHVWAVLVGILVFFIIFRLRQNIEKLEQSVIKTK